MRNGTINPTWVLCRYSGSLARQWTQVWQWQLATGAVQLDCGLPPPTSDVDCLLCCSAAPCTFDFTYFPMSCLNAHVLRYGPTALPHNASHHGCDASQPSWQSYQVRATKATGEHDICLAGSALACATPPSCWPGRRSFFSFSPTGVGCIDFRE